MTIKEILNDIYIRLENYSTALNDTYNDLVENDLEEELEWSANELKNEIAIVYELMYKIPKIEKEIELLYKYKRAFELCTRLIHIDNNIEFGGNAYWIGDIERSSYITKEEYEMLEKLLNDTNASEN